MSILKVIVIDPWLPCPATLLFNRLTRGLLGRFFRPAIICYNYESNNTALNIGRPNQTMKQILI